MKITEVVTRDVRFPTTRQADGSDAMNQGDYSATYVILKTDQPGLEGHGLTFTNGRGNELCIGAVHALAHHVRGRDLDGIIADMRPFFRSLTQDVQLRWLGPEKGILHMATGAVVNAVWDLWAKRAGKPVWKLLADLSPEQLVALTDFTYITDAITPDEALALLRDRQAGRADREVVLRQRGLPAYTTSPGWLGDDDEKLRRLTAEALVDGFEQIKLKVGASLQDDVRRCGIAREVMGPGPRLCIDANQAWDVPTAIAWTRALADFDITWIEEPTSPDDVVGHAAIARAVAPIGVATGEHAQNRVIFKQLLQLGAISYCQIDACRLAGVNEVLAVLLLAAKSGVPVCPHAGGVGLCELVQHLAAFDYVALGGELDDRVVEYVDHLHEHFVDPCVVERARYQVPARPGYSAEMRRESIARHLFPHGPVWADDAGQEITRALPRL